MHMRGYTVGHAETLALKYAHSAHAHTYLRPSMCTLACQSSHAHTLLVHFTRTQLHTLAHGRAHTSTLARTHAHVQHTFSMRTCQNETPKRRIWAAKGSGAEKTQRNAAAAQSTPSPATPRSHVVTSFSMCANFGTTIVRTSRLV